MMKRLRNYLVMGFIVLLPTIATLYILHFIFSFIDRILGNFLTKVLIALGLGFGFEERIPGLGFILMIVILIAVGYATRSLLGKEAIRFTENTFKRIPIAKSIYSTVQQVTTAFIQDRTSFKKVVLVEYPRKGVYTVGFLTGESQGEVQDKTQQECVNVFLPTTPNPTSGWLVLVPKQDVILLEMSVEQGLKFIISGGVVVPLNHSVVNPKETDNVQDLDQILSRLKVEEELQTELKVTIKGKGDSK